MYLVYINKQFFGNTLSKKVAQSIKQMYPAANLIHINEYAELSEDVTTKTDDTHRILLKELTDKDGVTQPVVTTLDELENAKVWINQQMSEMLLVESGDTQNMLDRLPYHIRSRLGNYRAFEYEQIFSEDGIIFDLTYEGYLMYLHEIGRE